ncbi:carbohydrate-binding module family 35 protein [Ramaria rubella]|nr:carbohydrate-binding module family 35 protein [Ramaria rubella]
MVKLQIGWFLCSCAVFGTALPLLEDPNHDSAERPTSSVCSSTNYIVPGSLWLDTDEVLIQAHGGGIVKSEDTFYWFGEDHTTGGPNFQGISVYSSKDLVAWTNLGHALSPIPGTQIADDKVAERPKAIFSPETNQWILYFHSDEQGYDLHLQGIATSPNVTGPYKYLGSYQPLGAPSQDFGLFLDDDGEAYALYGSGGNNDITRLNAQYTNESVVVHTFSGTNLEAPGMLHNTDGVYYHILSQKTGYRPNDDQLYTATNLSGPWSSSSTISPAGTNTWNSQNTFELKIAGELLTTFIYMGDRWDGDDLGDSRYMWLPITFGSNRSIQLQWHDIWTIYVGTGDICFPTGTSYEAEAGKLTGNATAVACATCSGGKIVTNVGNGSTITINNVVGSGNSQWVSFYYINTDSQLTALYRFASISVNGGAPITLKQPTSAAGVVLSVPLEVILEKENKNSITIGGISGLAGDLDKIVVYP